MPFFEAIRIKQADKNKSVLHPAGSTALSAQEAHPIFEMQQLVGTQAVRRVVEKHYSDKEEAGELEIRNSELLWESLKEVGIMKQSFGYLRGVVKGALEAGKGMLDMVLHPIETAKGMYTLVVNFDQTKKGMKKLVEEYWRAASEEPEKFAEMTGQLAGQIEVALVTPAKVVQGRDVAGALKTAGTIIKRAAGQSTPLWHYTHRAAAKSIEATSKTSMKILKGAKGVFATPLAPELGGSKSLSGMLARAGFVGGQVDFFARVGEKLKWVLIKPPFTHAVKFMSPEFKLLIRTQLEKSYWRLAKSILPQFGAESPQTVKLILLQALDDPVAMEKLLNGMGYVVMDTGIVVHAVEEGENDLNRE